MFDYTPEGPAYFLRFQRGRDDYLNLLYVPEPAAIEETNQSLLYLFKEYADPCGIVTYYDPHQCCIINERSKDFSEMRVYLYDEVAPYEGFYLDGRFIEALENV